MKTRKELLKMLETLKREEKVLRDLEDNDTVIIEYLTRISALKWLIRKEEENNNV